MKGALNYRIQWRWGRYRIHNRKLGNGVPLTDKFKYFQIRGKGLPVDFQPERAATVVGLRRALADERELDWILDSNLKTIRGEK